MDSKQRLKKSERMRGFNSKGYFHKVEPYCEEYLKAKHAVYQKSRKMQEDKEN